MKHKINQLAPTSSIIIFTLVLIIVALFLLMNTRASNAEALDRQLKNPEGLFRGVFNTETAGNDFVGILNGEEIHIFFNNDNLNYDEKQLTFASNEKGKGDSFNFYCVKPAGKSLGEGEDPEKLETTCYLCEYDGVNSVILLDEDNEEIGRISYTLGKEDWQGKRKLNYYWTMEGVTTPIYKRGDVPVSAGTSYLKSKYYSGEFLGD